MGKECDVADTNYNYKTQWVYKQSLYINLYRLKYCKAMSLLHDKYIIVYYNKAHNNIAFVCKSHTAW